MVLDMKVQDIRVRAGTVFIMLCSNYAFYVYILSIIVPDSVNCYILYTMHLSPPI